MNRLAILAALSGAVAVGVGAVAAHWAGEHTAEILKTGSHYQLVHAIAALVAMKFDARGAGWCFIAGATLFAGSLYWLSVGAPSWVGPVTPIGGALLIGGWLWLAWRARRVS